MLREKSHHITAFGPHPQAFASQIVERAADQLAGKPQAFELWIDFGVQKLQWAETSETSQETSFGFVLFQLICYNEL